jgi:hypothetical protein
VLVIALINVASPQDKGGEGSLDERFLIPSTVPKFALVVGVEHYERVERVKNAINDAVSIAQSLKKAGFTVRFLADANQDEIYDYTKDLVRRAGGVNDPAILVFYFAGHGFEDANHIPYMVPASARTGGFTVDDSVPIVNIMNALLANRRAGLTIFFLDACRTDFGEDSSFFGDQSLLFKLEPPGDGIFGMSTSAGFPANSSAGQGIENGPYALALAKHIPSLHVPLSEALDEVKFEVKDITRIPGFADGQKTAVLTIATYSKFYLNPQEEERESELVAWKAALRSEMPRCVRRYLDFFHGSAFLRRALEWLDTVAPISDADRGQTCASQ